jgi:hypothetical protein
MANLTYQVIGILNSTSIPEVQKEFEPMLSEYKNKVTKSSSQFSLEKSSNIVYFDIWINIRPARPH